MPAAAGFAAAHPIRYRISASSPTQPTKNATLHCGQAATRQNTPAPMAGRTILRIVFNNLVRFIESYDYRPRKSRFWNGPPSAHQMRTESFYQADSPHVPFCRVRAKQPLRTRIPLDSRFGRTRQCATSLCAIQAKFRSQSALCDVALRHTTRVRPNFARSLRCVTFAPSPPHARARHAD